MEGRSNRCGAGADPRQGTGAIWDLSKGIPCSGNEERIPIEPYSVGVDLKAIPQTFWDEFDDMLRQAIAGAIDEKALTEIFRLMPKYAENIAKLSKIGMPEEIATDIFRRELVTHLSPFKPIKVTIPKGLISPIGMEGYSIKWLSIKDLFNDILNSGRWGPQTWYEIYEWAFSKLSLNIQISSGALYLQGAIDIFRAPLHPVTSIFCHFERTWLSSFLSSHKTVLWLFENGVFHFTEMAIWHHFFVGGFVGMWFGAFYGRLDGNPYFMSTYYSLYSP